MPTYVPVYRRRLDPETGEPIYGPDGLEVRDLVEVIEVPDDPIYTPTEEDLAVAEAQRLEILAQQSQLLQESTENP